jgi:mono/diheme cytochrome c family protein
MRTLALLVLILIALAGAGVYFYVRATGISALQPPSGIEEYAAIRAKHWLVHRASEQGSVPTETPATADSATEGHVQYGSSCASCHGYDGRTPTKLGESMSPRAPSLALPRVQNYNNAEIYTVVHDGIRMSGMPGFGSSLSSDQIWNLVHYVRSLPSAAKH